MLPAVKRRVDDGVIFAAVQGAVSFVGQLGITQRQTRLQHHIAQLKDLIVRHQVSPPGFVALLP